MTENTHKLNVLPFFYRSAYKRPFGPLVPRLSPYIRGLWCVCLRASSRQPPTPRYALLLAIVRITGLEPARDSPLEPKSSASANSAISANNDNYIKPNTTVSMLFHTKFIFSHFVLFPPLPQLLNFQEFLDNWALLNCRQTRLMRMPIMTILYFCGHGGIGRRARFRF